jgi:hypothetical protein
MSIRFHPTIHPSGAGALAAGECSSSVLIHPSITCGADWLPGPDASPGASGGPLAPSAALMSCAASRQLQRAAVLFYGANRAASSPTTSACREQSLGLCGWLVGFSPLLDRYGARNSFPVYMTRMMGCALTLLQNDARVGHSRDLLTRRNRDIAKSARCCWLGRGCFALNRRRRGHLA